MGVLTHRLVYVDDIILTCNNISFLRQLIHKLGRHFAMKDLWMISYFLGIEAHCQSSGLFLTEAKYTMDPLAQAEMADAKPISSPIASNAKLSLNSGVSLSNLTEYYNIIDGLK